jgi:alcohol dehydrogenase class IV
VAGVSPEAGAQAAVAAIDRLCADLDVPSLRALGVPSEHFEQVVEQMAQDALASGSPANNPRQATAAEIVSLYRASY